MVQTTGGAGVGDPLERDPDVVKEDVMNERVSARKAKEDYGVVFIADEWPYEVLTLNTLKSHILAMLYHRLYS